MRCEHLKNVANRRSRAVDRERGGVPERGSRGSRGSRGNHHDDYHGHHGLHGASWASWTIHPLVALTIALPLLWYALLAGFGGFVGGEASE